MVQQLCRSKCVLCGKWENEDEIVECEDCGQRCCQECVKADYRNFSYSNGNVDIVSVCREGCKSPN